LNCFFKKRTTPWTGDSTGPIFKILQFMYAMIFHFFFTFKKSFLIWHQGYEQAWITSSFLPFFFKLAKCTFWSSIYYVHFISVLYLFWVIFWSWISYKYFILVISVNSITPLQNNLTPFLLLFKCMLCFVFEDKWHNLTLFFLGQFC
jgi:hypothetical protein